MNAKLLAQQYIDPKITVCNLISIAVMIFGGGIVYAQIVSYMSENDKRVARVETQIRESSLASGVKDDRTSARFDALVSKMHTVEMTTARTDERIKNILDQLQEQSRQRRTQ